MNECTVCDIFPGLIFIQMLRSEFDPLLHAKNDLDSYFILRIFSLHLWELMEKVTKITNI